MKTIVLIGMPGCGKTSYGKRAARELELEFIDTDAFIEEREGRSIAEIFRDCGEARFRRLETDTLRLIHKEAKRFRAGRGLIVSLGGGSVEIDENIHLMRELGTVLFIDRKPEHIREDVMFDSKRPLLSTPEKLTELYERRIGRYRQAAHYTLNNDGSYPETLERFMNLICLYGVAGNFMLIGDPVAHSLSPQLHGAAFERLGMHENYRALRVPPQELADAMALFRAGQAVGMNVTIPHKFAVTKYLDELRGDAKHSGAVNTVVREQGKLVGYNTDMDGLKAAFQRHHRSYKDANVVVIGAGGAASGIVHKAAADGAKQITVLCRSPKKGEAIAASARAYAAQLPPDSYSPGSSALTATETAASKQTKITTFVVNFAAPDSANAPAQASQLPAQSEQSRSTVPDTNAETPAVQPPNLPAVLASTDILCNATPLGMDGNAHDFTDFDFLKLLPPHAFVCDLVYKPRETALLTAAKQLGLDGCNGLEMLIYQGILAEELFLNRELQRDEMFTYISRATADPQDVVLDEVKDPKMAYKQERRKP